MFLPLIRELDSERIQEIFSLLVLIFWLNMTVFEFGFIFGLSLMIQLVRWVSFKKGRALPRKLRVVWCNLFAGCNF